MQYTKLGNSELNVSRICMGCMGFGDANCGAFPPPVKNTCAPPAIRKYRFETLRRDDT